MVLVGGGPGDPELITLAGRRALVEADVVVADRLAPPPSSSELPPDIEVVDVAKLPRGRSATQEQINRLMVEARPRRQAGGPAQGRRPVRVRAWLRGAAGLPGGRRAGARCSRGSAAPSAYPRSPGVPVTHRGVTHEMTVVSGHLPPGHPESLVEWGALARLRGTMVLMMAVENPQAIADVLIETAAAADTPVAVIRRAHADRSAGADHLGDGRRRRGATRASPAGDHRDRRGGGGRPTAYSRPARARV